MAVLTSDVTLAKMAGREIHPWVVLMSMGMVWKTHTTSTSVPKWKGMNAMDLTNKVEQTLPHHHLEYYYYHYDHHLLLRIGDYKQEYFL